MTQTSTGPQSGYQVDPEVNLIRSIKNDDDQSHPMFLPSLTQDELETPIGDSFKQLFGILRNLKTQLS